MMFPDTLRHPLWHALIVIGPLFVENVNELPGLTFIPYIKNLIP